MRAYIAILQTLTWGAQTLGDSLRYAVARLQHRDFDRASKSEQVGTAMTLDHDALQSDHGGAIVPPRIHSSSQRAQARSCRERSEFAQRTARQFLTKSLRNQACRALHGLQRDIASLE